MGTCTNKHHSVASLTGELSTGQCFLVHVTLLWACTPLACDKLVGSCFDQTVLESEDRLI